MREIWLKAISEMIAVLLIAALLLLGAGLLARVYADESGLNVLRTPVYGFTAWKLEDGKKYAAGAGSTFYVVRTKGSKTYVIFDDEDEIVKAPSHGITIHSKVKIDQIYEINKSELPYTYRMRWGLAHGPLVVPFKYRLNDGSLSGESMIGYYMGLKSKALLLSGTAFITAGLSLNSISDTNEKSNGAGLSWAIGYGVETKTGFQAALVIGSDHSGDAAGDNWISFSIGFNFMD